jgi:hypothetical protein
MQPSLVAGFLSLAECRELIDRADERGFRSPEPEYPPSYRNNDRQVLDDPELAARLLERLRPHLPERLRAEGRDWRLYGLNERMRLCRYRPGQRFGVHRDGVHYREGGRQSRLTFVVYLNDATEFAGGSTRFYPERGAPPSASVPPAAGTLVLFTHDLWHDGEEVSSGVKYVLRSDVLYQSDSPERASPAPRGYLWNVVEIGAGRLATGSRDPGVWLWRRSVEGAIPYARLDGHLHSATALLAAAPGLLWSGSRDRTVRAWRLAGDRVAPGPVLRGHEGAVLHLARLRAGAVASASADGTIRWWRPEGEPLGTLPAAGGWVWALAVLDDDRVISGTEDGALRVWDLTRSRLVAEIGRAPAPVRALVALADGAGVASGHTDGCVRVWTRNARGWSLSRELAGHRSDVRALARLPGGALASGSEDGTVRVWDASRPGGVVVGRHADFVTGLCLLSDGTLASASYDGTVGLWQPPS